MLSRLTALALVIAAAAPAWSAEAEGRIKSFDAQKLMITLDDGQSYRLPAEIDLTAIAEGIEIVILYEEVQGVKQITDMALPE